MWKLILFLMLLPFFDTSSKPKKEVIFILDNCENWDRLNFQHGTSQFSYYCENKDFPLIYMVHAWIDEENKLSTKSLTFPEIMDSEHLFTSQLKLKDWYELSNDSSPRVFILNPEDYCSEKRFIHDYKFTLYEVHLNVTREE